MNRKTGCRMIYIALLSFALYATSGVDQTLASSMFDEPPGMTGNREHPSEVPQGGGFEKDDANGDGKVTRSEFGGPDNLFDQLDRNGDGIITREEAKPPQSRDRREPR